MESREDAIKDFERLIAKLESAILESKLASISAKGQWQIVQINADIYTKRFEIIKIKKMIKEIRNTSDEEWFSG